MTTSIFASTVLLNNNFLQEFMRTCIEKVRDQAPAALLAKARDDFDRFFQPQNPNLYYGYLHIKCYYFCQQYENYFEVVGSQGHKCVLFAARFLKDYILN